MGFVSQISEPVFETGFVSPNFVGGMAVGALIVAVMMLSFVYFEREIGDMGSVTGLCLLVLAVVFGPTVEVIFESVGGVLTAAFVLAALVFARSAVSFVFDAGRRKESRDDSSLEE